MEESNVEEMAINISEESTESVCITGKKSTNTNPQRMQLISKIQQLPDKELSSANNLLSIMRYPKGPNKGEIISPYLQRKVYEYFAQSLYKQKLDYKSLQDSNSKLEKQNKKLQQKNLTLIRRTQSIGAKAQHLKSQKLKHISEIRSLVRRLLIKNFTSLHTAAECMRLVYEFLTSEPPLDRLSISTLHTWHLDVSESHFNKLIDQAKKASIFGLMIDESTRGQTKYLVFCYQFWCEKDQMPVVMVAQLQTIIKCNAEVVSDTVIMHIQKSGLDIKKCALWVTDNTSYLSGEKKGAISLFNKKTNTSSLRIDLEIRFAEELEDDFKNGITDTFGLRELLLQDRNFYEEFKRFSIDDKLFIYDFPELYNFVKNRVYFIIIHQQQVEGLFNKLDLKTHPNMSLSLKQSKLQLSSGKIDKENLLDGLKEIKENRKKLHFKKCAHRNLGLILLQIFLIIFNYTYK
ncbi:12616_t:CDS:2 [Gigaspora margarita]|uniref:12616_t:CDS:1 n=1 Tax=Gigaspora margarita TaxID=4874 RepID=A0ABN7USQ4_GIGMA|nr:12616_t:CDS:2 [Gigaspora margarita]